MKGIIELEIKKGSQAGKKYSYSENERIFIGRNEDCAIEIPDKTISRYHCMLDFQPPVVKLQDVGSLNGTYINGKKIGQRERDQSWEEAKDMVHEEFELHDGDVLGLSNSCEIAVNITALETCPLCGAILPKLDAGMETDDNKDNAADIPCFDDNGLRICKSCWEKQKADRLMAEMQAKLNGTESTCVCCGKKFKPTGPDNNLCPDCMKDEAKRLLDGILAALLEKKKPQKVTPGKPALLDGYDKVSSLGEGGMGQVWKVKERSTGKYYALKTMLPTVAVDEHSKTLFLREASICENLHHKNVVKTYKTGSVNGVFYILMDLCEGGSVDGLMEKKGGKLPLPLATYITLQVLSGLDYVHNMDLDVEVKVGRFQGTKEVEAKGAVHRDFKPGNIFLSDRSDHPVAMVADFGMAKAFSTAGLSRVTKSGTVMGTPVFMPRQQVKSCKYAKPEVDVWAAAASYYNMLTGQFPRNFRQGKNVMQTILTEKAVPIRERDASIPHRLAAVIDKALQEDPVIGYQSAADFRRDLIDVLPPNVLDYCNGVIK